MNYQGSSDRKLAQGTILLTCISSEARNLMDAILDQCPPDIRDDETTDRFLTWLHQSRLILTASIIE